MPSQGGQKDINVLKGLVQKNGFKLVPSGKGHLKLQKKNGTFVVDEKGPVIISGTASDNRAREMHVKRLMAAGALKADPFKATASSIGDREKTPDEKKRAHADRLRSPEMQALKVAAVKEKARERGRRTNLLRARLEPVIVKIGGWNQTTSWRNATGVQASDLGVIWWHLRQTRGRLDGPTSPDGARAMAQNFKKGGTLSDSNMDFLEWFLDEYIEPRKTSSEALREWYFDTLRAAKQLPPAERESKITVVPEKKESIVNHLTPVPSNGQPEQEAEVHLLEAAHRAHGLTWDVRFDLDDLAKLNRAMGVFEIVVESSGESARKAYDNLTSIADKIGEQRFKSGEPAATH